MRMKTDTTIQQGTLARHERIHGSLVFPNLLKLAAEADGLKWEPFHPGVEIHWIYRVEGQGASAALIRFQPGSSVPLHEHRGFEHIYILSGSQSDENGPLHTGSLMVHPPGTRHSISSAEGCLALAIYEKPAKFIGDNGGGIS
jgi:anti-sigma factor ChrR (cupin superfamily)